MAFTYFFRDGQTLDLIAEHIMPELKRRRHINVWDAGCAHGPEPYSLAITIREQMGHFMFRNVTIHATDIDESNLFGEIIGNGVYPYKELQRIPRDLFERYFTPHAAVAGCPADAAASPDGALAPYRISEEVRRAVRYRRHDLLSLQPIRDGLDMVMCKNVLLHFAPEARVQVMRMFHAALAPDGYLVTEQTQKLPPELEPLFRRVTNAGQLFQKVAT